MTPPPIADNRERLWSIGPVAVAPHSAPVRTVTLGSSVAQSAALARVRLKVAILESDAAVRSMLVRALERLGHFAVVPGEGTAAWGSPEYPAAAIDCVLLDVPLPATFGRRAAAALECIDGGTGVVLMSHAPAGEVVEALPLLPDPVVLPKPFALADLEEAIRRSVNGPARSGVAA